MKPPEALHALTELALAERLLALHLDVGDRAGAWPLLAGRLAEAMSAPAAILTRRGAGWEVRAHSPADHPFTTDPDAAAVLDRVRHDEGTPTREWQNGHGVWTLAVSRSRPVVAVAVRGEWAALAPVLAATAQNLALIARVWVGRERARSRAAVHRLSRELERAATPQAVWQAIVRAMARTSGARIAALAVPDPADQRLAIVATRGYPLELVEHLRIEPGTGILGTVFRSGKTLHVESGAPPSGLRRRPRYRSDSFIAMPIGPAQDPLGVVCVTDQEDNRAFTRDDLSNLRALAAPAALALGRQRAFAQAEKYAHAAAVDAVSGVFNRRYFQSRLDEELQRSVRHGLSVALLMIDIDDFKIVNDRFGHLVGDTVIRDVADILRRSVRVFDVCARFGGEEFAILMPGTAVESAARVAGRVRERIEAYRPFDRGLDALRITVSVGLAVSSAGMTGTDLIARSDEALYFAKREGKNRLHILG